LFRGFTCGFDWVLDKNNKCLQGGEANGGGVGDNWGFCQNNLQASTVTLAGRRRARPFKKEWGSKRLVSQKSKNCELGCLLRKDKIRKGAGLRREGGDIPWRRGWGGVPAITTEKRLRDLPFKKNKNCQEARGEKTT